MGPPMTCYAPEHASWLGMAEGNIQWANAWPTAWSGLHTQCHAEQ
jgi:hypothetical protein